MKPLEALIFDVDGTLADTEEIHRQAFNRAFREFDLDWDWTPRLYEELLAISGGRERITYYGGDLAANYAHPEEFTHFVIELHRLKTRLYAEMLDAGEVPLRCGVERLLGEARKAGLTLAIATSSTFSNLKTLLDGNLTEDWPGWFSAIATCDTVTEKKPSPAVYLEVLQKLNVDPTKCLAVEDTVNGCLAATGAQLNVLITTHFFTRHHHFPNAALVLDSLGDPDQPFYVTHGDPGEHEFVDIDLLQKLVSERSEREPVVWDGEVQIATA